MVPRICWCKIRKIRLKSLAVDIIPEKVELINNPKAPIQDDYIENILKKKNGI